MLVKFHPSGDVADTTMLTPSRGYSGGPYAIPVIGAAPGTTSEYYGGEITSGSVLGYVASAGRAMLLWKTPSNATVKSWPMDDLAAVNTAIATIGDALGTDEIITINSTGNEYTGS